MECNGIDDRSQGYYTAISLGEELSLSTLMFENTLLGQKNIWLMMVFWTQECLLSPWLSFIPAFCYDHWRMLVVGAMFNLLQAPSSHKDHKAKMVVVSNITNWSKDSTHLESLPAWRLMMPNLIQEGPWSYTTISKTLFILKVCPPDR